MNKLIHIIIRAVAAFFLLLPVISCEHTKHGNNDYRRVVILYSAGYNSLSEYLKDDIADLKSGYLPASNGDDALLIISKIAKKSGDYSTAVEPSLTRISKGGKKGNEVKCDTLMKMDASAKMTDVGTLRSFLEYIEEQFPAKSYGMIVSSHGNGWLPECYFENPSHFENNASGAATARRMVGDNGPIPYIEAVKDPSEPDVKSITQEVETIGKFKYSYEMDIEDFAAAIPMHLDYILFDACLMGGIEVAHSLQGVTDVISVSPTEVIAEGYDYVNICKSLFSGTSVNLVEVCRNFYDYFNGQEEGQYRSATITLVDLNKLDNLTQVCAGLFDKYNSSIASLNPSLVQSYSQKFSKHWFYDLYDIVTKAGADAKELAELQEAIDYCVMYKAATPTFMNSLEIKCFSGFSMYLPSHGSDYLDEFYKSLSWNKATGLVR